jgi:hypothetical protein
MVPIRPANHSVGVDRPEEAIRLPYELCVLTRPMPEICDWYVEGLEVASAGLPTTVNDKQVIVAPLLELSNRVEAHGLDPTDVQIVNCVHDRWSCLAIRFHGRS